MGIHASILPRDAQPISRQALFERLIAAGMFQHPNTYELTEEEGRDDWQFSLISDEAGIGWVEEKPEIPANVSALMRISGASDPDEISNWAHHLWSIAQQANSDIIFEDPRPIMVLPSFVETDATGQPRLVRQPPLRPVAEDKSILY